MISTDPTQEDIDVQSFRILHRVGSVCCEGHHFEMVAFCLVSDYRDAEIMHRGVRSVESLREFGMQHGWLREDANDQARKCDLGHKAPILGEYLKNILDN